MSTPPETEPAAVKGEPEPWEELRVKVPASWKRELEKVARIRALSVAALVRQAIRALMIQRHEGPQ